MFRGTPFFDLAGKTFDDSGGGVACSLLAVSDLATARKEMGSFAGNSTTNLAP